MKIQPHQKLLCIGDSITDAGRAQPVAEGLFDPLGKGYVAMVDALIHSTYPDRHIRIVNVGSGGHTVRDLKARWQRDVIDLKPDWLSIMIGINDVWRQFDLPRQKEIHVGPQEYESTLEELIAATKPRLAGGLILMTPYYIDPNRHDAMRARMDEYGSIVHKLAQKHAAVFVDTQAAFDQRLKHCHASAISWDRVHPNQTGHMTIARAMLNALGYQW